MKPDFTDAEKLDVIERLIIHGTESVGAGNPVLKAIATDIRAKSRTTATIALLDRAIQNAKLNATPKGYPTGNLKEIADLVIGRWPTIRQALKEFEP